MKRLIAIFIALPGLSLAHGAHPPVPEVAHATVHNVIIAVLIIALAALVLYRGSGRDRS